MYDIDKIIEEASPAGIVKYLRIPSKESGKVIFIECPVHEKNTGSRDRHIDNCVLGKTFQKAFYCFSCQGSGNVFSLIAGYLNLNIKNDFTQILKIAAESCGGEELFIISESDYNKKRKEKEKTELFGVLSDELKELGISSNLFTNNYISSFDESQIVRPCSEKKDINFDVYTENQLNKISYVNFVSQNKLFSSLNRDIYHEIIKGKAKEKMELYKRLSTDVNLYQSSLFSSIDSNLRRSLAEEIKNEYRQKYILVENIYSKVASEEEVAQIDDSWLYDISF